jgi:L-fucose isomerase-like protein
MNISIGFIVLGRKRPGFDQEFGRKMTERVTQFVASTNYEVFQPKDKVVDDASLKRALNGCREHQVDLLLTLQPTMADGRLAPTTVLNWDKPIILWATPENQQGDMISSCSLVGVHNWASILRRMHHPFEIVYGGPDDAGTAEELDRAVKTCYAASRLRSAKVGLVGSHAPGYFSMAARQFGVFDTFGLQLQSYGLQEFSDIVHGLDEAEVSGDVKAVKAMGMPLKDVESDALPMASRLYLAMRHYYENEAVDGLAVRCWPEMPNIFGQWPYLGMTRLASEDYPVSVEGDVDGTICALAGKYLGLGPCHSSDWLEHDAETITLWHGGNLPFSMSPTSGNPGAPTIANHFNIRKPAVIESTMKPGMPVTMIRLWEIEGAYKLMAVEAETIKPKRHLMGSNGLVRLNDTDARELFLELAYQGMPHHVSVFEGHHRELLRQFARIMSIEWVDC